MKILITGHLGFVGSHFYEHFKQPGNEVWGIDNGDPEWPLDVKELPTSRFASAFDLAIHCAANIGGRDKIDNQQLWVAENMLMDYAFLQWAAWINSAKRVVLFSSSAAYPVKYQSGIQPHVLVEDDIDLDDVRSPDASYGWAKLTLEQLARWSRPDALILRPFSGYSHTQSKDYPFNAILDRVKHRERPLNIWSDTVRDFIHIDDIVGATLALLDAERTGPYNLCTGIGTSFTELARQMATAVGYSPPIHQLGRNPGVAYRVGDNHKLRRFYKPKVSLAEGIERGL